MLDPAPAAAAAEAAPGGVRKMGKRGAGAAAAWESALSNLNWWNSPRERVI